MTDTYRKRALFAVPLDAKRATALLPGGGARTDISLFALQILSECTTFQTLEQHAERIALTRKTYMAEPAEIRRVLRHLFDEGHFVSKSRLLTCTGEEVPPRPGKIDAVCIGTRDRPGGVDRCIRSYVANMRAYGRAPTWTVLDSSPDPAARRGTLEALEILGRDEVDIRYATGKDKAAFAAALAEEAQVDPELVRFAFFDIEGLNNDTGANRNALLLAHAGELLLSVDDDTVCEFRRAAHSGSEQLELASFRMPGVTLFEDIGKARASLHGTVASALGVHEELLGRTLGEFFRDRRPQDVATDGLFDGTVETILAGQARVAATVGGFWGDCAATSAAYYLFCNGPPPEDLPNAEPVYRRLISSRQVLRAPPRTTVTQSTNIMAANLGVDLRDLMPPFFPTRRASDLVFGTIVSRCFEGRFFGLLPLAVGHLPFESRTADPDALWGTAKPKLATIIFNAIQLASLELAVPGAPRLRLLGRNLTELASLPWQDFEQLLLRRAWQDVAGMIHLVQNRLRVAPPSSPWSRDARAYIEALSRSLDDTNLVVPHSVRENRSSSDARILMQRLVRRFGELLQAWPDLFAAAQRLREREISLAQRIPSRNG